MQLQRVLRDSQTNSAFFYDVIAGLCRSHKRLPSKYLYDECGSKLFEEITKLDEYYLARTETEIMKKYLPEMADEIGAHCKMVEFGSGSSEKTRLLLRKLKNPISYSPIDISITALTEATQKLKEEFPALQVLPIHTDYSNPLLFKRLMRFSPFAVFFPGSTLGNFEKGEACSFLQNLRLLTGTEGGVLIGIDMIKDSSILLSAYNDRKGITAKFIKNILMHINNEIGADFDMNAFDYKVNINWYKECVEMYLISKKEQSVHIANHEFYFAENEAIHVENSHKYSIPSFQYIVNAAGFEICNSWIDKKQFYTMHYLKAKPKLLP